jgi:hypothetical protein
MRRMHWLERVNLVCLLDRLKEGTDELEHAVQ